MRQAVKAVEAQLAEEKAKADQDRKALLGKLEEEGRSGTTQVRGAAGIKRGGRVEPWRHVTTTGMCD